MGGAASINFNESDKLESTCYCIQRRYAEFSSYYGPRVNGWKSHVLIFGTNVQENTTNATYPSFTYDNEKGTITTLKNITKLCIECWWQGHAPFGYKFLKLIKRKSL